MQALSEQWKQLSEDERAQHYREQEHLRELHRIQHPDYKYSPSPRVLGRQAPPAAPTPPPVSPNQPPEAPEEEEPVPNQPPAAIQVPRPLAQLRTQSIIVGKARPGAGRPAPGLIPVQTYSRHQPAAGPTLLTQKAGPAHSLPRPILNIPSRPGSAKMSSTFTPSAQPYIGQQEPAEEEHPVLSLPEPLGGGLDLADLPQDAADMLGLAVHSSGLGQDQLGQQYIIQGDSITPRLPGQPQKFIQIGGDNYEVVTGGGEQEQSAGQQLLYHQEQELLMQTQPQLMLEQGQQLMLEQGQQLMLAEDQMVVNQDQPVYVDELGRQLQLTPEQQMLVQQQQQQQMLLAYQEQQIIYQDQDVMTID
jgi:hypothetical protein